MCVSINFVLFECAKTSFVDRNNRLYRHVGLLVPQQLWRKSAVVFIIKYIIWDSNIVDVIALAIVKVVVNHDGIAIVIIIEKGAVAKELKVAVPHIVCRTLSGYEMHFCVHKQFCPMRSHCHKYTHMR